MKCSGLYRAIFEYITAKMKRIEKELERRKKDALRIKVAGLSKFLFTEKKNTSSVDNRTVCCVKATNTRALLSVKNDVEISPAFYFEKNCETGRKNDFAKLSFKRSFNNSKSKKFSPLYKYKGNICLTKGISFV